MTLAARNMARRLFTDCQVKPDPLPLTTTSHPDPVPPTPLSNKPTNKSCRDSNSGTTTDDDFLPIPHSKAIKSTFPPGCSVMACCYTGTVNSTEQLPSQALRVSHVLHGKVAQVGINLADQGNRETLYQVPFSDIGNKTTTTIILQERDLQFAMGTPVWLWNDDIDQYRPAVVIRSEHFPAFTDDRVLSSFVLYSVQVLTGNCKVYHGILLESLVYRTSKQPPKPNTTMKDIRNTLTIKPTSIVSTSMTTVAHVPLAEIHVDAVVPQVPITTHQEQPPSVNDVSQQMAQTQLTDNEDAGIEDGEIEEASSSTPIKQQPVEETLPLSTDSPVQSSPSALESEDDDDSLEEGEILDTSPSSHHSSYMILQATESTSVEGPPLVTPKPTNRSLLAEFMDADRSSTPRHSMKQPSPESAKDLTFRPMTSDQQPVIVDHVPQAAEGANTSEQFEGHKEAFVVHGYANGSSLPNNEGAKHSKSTTQAQISTVPPQAYGSGLSNQIPNYMISTTGNPTSNQVVRPLQRVVRDTNHYPTSFQVILFGADHRHAAVLNELRSLTVGKTRPTVDQELWDVRDIVFRRCLPWHLKGSCWSDCKRRHDHMQLTPGMANALEDALKPWMSMSGPIFCHPVTSFANSDIDDKLQDPPAKRVKVHHRVDPKRTPGSTSSSVSVTMHLPSFFGKDLLVDTIMGKNHSSAQDLCDMFGCSMDIQLLPATNSVVAVLTGSSRQSLSKCQVAIEHVLARSVPWELRGYMLYNLGDRNSYRTKNGNTVLTINSFANGHGSGENLHHLTVLRANWSNEGITLFGKTDENTFQTVFEAKHPQCRTKLVKKHKAWPDILPHIVISGSKLEDVQACRKSVLAWMRSGRLV